MRLIVPTKRNSLLERNTTMICSKCGNIAPDSAAYCPFCGAQAQGAQPMPSVQEAPVQVVPFCHICGLELAQGAQVCPVCGAAAGAKEKTPAFSAVYGTASTPQADTPAQGAEDFSDFGDLGSAAAMTVTVPLKKKSRLPLIAGICAGVVAVLAGVVALNRSTFLPIFMGKAGYAAMIEGKGAADALSAIDSPVTAAVLENAAESAARYAVMANGGYMMSGGASPADIIAQTRNSLLSAYGKDEVDVALTPSVELTETGRDALFGGDASYDEIVNAINACTMKTTLNAQEDATSLRLTLDEQGAVTDADVIVTKDMFYVNFPFAGEAFNGALTSGPESAESARLELDPAQTARLLKQIGSIYIKHYKSAEFTVESGELTAAGVTAKGQLVSCTMDGERLNAMAQEIGALLAEDEYLSGVITEYAQANGVEITVQDYADAVMQASSELFGDNCSVTVKTVVNSACKTLAKSYVFTGQDTLSLTYINGREKGALEISGGSMTVTADLTRVNRQDGTVNIRFADGKTSFSAKLVYNGVKTQKFCEREIIAGEFRLSCVPPADFTSGDSAPAAVYAAISKAELTLSQSVEKGALKQRAELRMPQYGTAAIDAVATAKDGAAIEIPAKAIDIYAMFGSDEDTRASAEMMRGISQKADRNGYFAAMIADAAEDYAQYLEDSLKPQADIGDISIMMSNIRGLQSTANELYNLYADVMTDELRERCDDICSSLEELADSIDYTMTEERYAELSAEVDKADEVLGELIKALNKAQDAKVPISQRGEIDYSDLSSDEIGEAFSACEMDYLSIILVYYDAISEDEELVELYNKTLSAYEKASADYYTMVNEISHKNWSVPIVRTARKSLQKFDEALTELEKKLPASQL